ncbi:MAG: TIGR00153 family protein [Woeseiaceae bacterium]|nr:TIGR00153 family protein [Woeseiaceae bacterium]
MAIGDAITNLFGKSPIKPIQQHFKLTTECTDKLIPFFEAATAGDWDRAAELREEISVLEERADSLKKQMRLQIHKSLFLPMPRNHLLELIKLQDKVTNQAKDIVGIMLGRKIQIPEPLVEPMTEYLMTTVSVVNQTSQAINELDELVESGFGSRAASLIEDLVEKIDDLEHQTDVQQVALRTQLFAIEASLPPIDVMFLYKTIENIGVLADRAETVGGVIHILVSR